MTTAAAMIQPVVLERGSVEECVPPAEVVVRPVVESEGAEMAGATLAARNSIDTSVLSDASSNHESAGAAAGGGMAAVAPACPGECAAHTGPEDLSGRVVPDEQFSTQTPLKLGRTTSGTVVPTPASGCSTHATGAPSSVLSSAPALLTPYPQATPAHDGWSAGTPAPNMMPPLGAGGGAGALYNTAVGAPLQSMYPPIDHSDRLSVATGISAALGLSVGSRSHAGSACSNTSSMAGLERMGSAASTVDGRDGRYGSYWGGGGPGRGSMDLTGANEDEQTFIGLCLEFMCRVPLADFTALRQLWVEIEMQGTCDW